MSEPAVVLITGTSRGIGNHLARHFLDRGWAVVGCSRAEYAGFDGEDRYRHHVVDVGSEEDVVRMFRAIRRRHGRLDVAINNAAHNPTLSLVALTPASATADALVSNVLGPFLVCREAVRLMMRKRSGRIVNLGSMATRHDVEGDAIYTSCKAAIGAMTRVLAKEVGRHGITCNVVAPAAVSTELMAAVDSERIPRLLERNAIPEIGSADEVSATVDWLISPQAAAITGQTIYLGGA